jgi:hypothetical protein
MLHRPRPPHPPPQLLVLLEETMLSVIQLLIARHPDLLAAPEELDRLVAEPPLRAAHRILDALRETAQALDAYRDVREGAYQQTSGAHDETQP